MTTLKSRRKRRRSTFPLFLIVLLFLAGAGTYVFFTYFEGEKPLITGLDVPTFIGKKTPLHLTLSDTKSGLRSIRISLLQKGTEKEILSTDFARQGKNGRHGPAQEQIDIDIIPQALKAKEGDATIKVRLTDYSLRGFMKGNTSERLYPVKIDTIPPKVTILHSTRYIAPGGAGVVMYSAAGTVKHGVMLNNRYHPGFPITDGSDDKYVSFVALPYATKTITQAVIVAEDAAGNRTSKVFAPILKKARQKKDKITLSDGFLGRKIPEFEGHYPEMKGDLLQQYLYANRVIRKENNQKISDLCQNPTAKQLWSGRFLRMAGSAKAGFADHRTYFYKGKAIDKQVHLGMDIASTRHVPIKAAGTGIVVFGDYLGIYGNMVLIDHGQGLFSLYSHLSQINVSPGDLLQKGDILGNSGTSGMAGGDHLHFSILVNGIFVTPKEWWDQHWIDITIDDPLVDAKF